MKKKALISVIVIEIMIILLIIGVIVWLSLPKDSQQAGRDFGNISDYSWEEFEALTDQEKLEFSKEFEGEDFEKWMEAVKPQDTTVVGAMPWEQGGKQPDEFTWQEYEALTAEQQMGFFNWFDSVESFDAWMNSAKPQETVPEGDTMPWEQGGKQPDEYTWQEYEGLTDEEQMAFFNWFASSEDFDAWMNRVKPQEQETVPAGAMPWERGGKQPNEYTWEEYEALNAEQQMAFFYWFDSPEAFDAWMNRAKSQETVPEGDAMPWEQGGKQPNEYTWEEYEALTADQQMAFFYWFDSVEDFDAWLNAAQNP